MKSTNDDGEKYPTSLHMKQVLWNVVDPGDPYDVKKSMIVNLPGHKLKFMGDNL